MRLRETQPKNWLQKEIPYWRQAGGQDAGNVMDPNEIEELFGPTPTHAQIKRWLINTTEHDVEDQLPDGWVVTAEDKAELVDAWADGWASYAVAYMRRRVRPW